MIPGELLAAAGEIELNAGRKTLEVVVANTGDRPIQVGSHFHFFETNAALRFDRAAARGFRLDIAAGTAVRFEPGQERSVRLVALDGDRVVYGFNALVMGPLDAKPKKSEVRKAAATKAKPAPAKKAASVTKKVANKIAAPTKTAGKKPAPKKGARK